VRPKPAWPKAKIIEIQANEKWALNGGPFGSKLVSSMYFDEGVPVIRGVNLPLERRFLMQDFVFVSEQKAQELRANWARPLDVVFTQRGTLGQVGLIPKDSPYDRFVISQSQMKLTVDTKRASPEFIYYTFRAPETVQRITDLASSSGVPHINLETLRQFEITLPSLDVQHRIAGILSAYDDLIEVNTRRITILEEMARRLFDEWFVKCRVPAEKRTLITTLSDSLPSGRIETALADIASVNADTISPADAPSVIHYIDISSVSPGVVNEIRTLAFSEAPGRARRRVRSGDILWSMVRPNRRSHALLVRPQPDTIASTGFAVLTARTVPWSYLYLALTTDQFVSYLEGRTRGSTYPAVSASDFEEATLLLPPKKALQEFDRHATPTLELADGLHHQNQKLRAARDLLLPKLISGEIDLSGSGPATKQAAAE